MGPKSQGGPPKACPKSALGCAEAAGMALRSRAGPARLGPACWGRRRASNGDALMFASEAELCEADSDQILREPPSDCSHFFPIPLLRAARSTPRPTHGVAVSPDLRRGRR